MEVKINCQLFMKKNSYLETQPNALDAVSVNMRVQ